MPIPDDRAQWRELAQWADRISEAARDDPYDARLAEGMQALAGEIATLNAGDESRSTNRNPEERALRAATHASAGAAWFTLLDSQRALAEFDAALEVLSPEGAPSPDGATTRAQALCGRGKCLVVLPRSPEAIPLLGASIRWYTPQGDPSHEALQSLLSQALHTLGSANADAGDHEEALDATARALELRWRLAERHGGRFRLALSRSPGNLGNWLNELGRRDEALQSRPEMLELRREQWRLGPTTAATLALALPQGEGTLARELAESGRDLEDALTLVTESAALYRELHRTCPRRFASTIEQQIELLLALADRFANAGVIQQTRQAAGATLSPSHAYSRARDSVDVNAPKLPQTLSRLSIMFRVQRRRAEALRAAKKVVELCRALAHANPQAFTPVVARPTTSHDVPSVHTK